MGLLTLYSPKFQVNDPDDTVPAGRPPLSTFTLYGTLSLTDVKVSISGITVTFVPVGGLTVAMYMD